MRNAFADEITKLGKEDPRVLLLVGDIGNRLFDRYKESQSERFFNCGIAEANMISVAAGLALNGFRPICYTITPFITARCLEQIRVDVCYHEAPVIIVGVGSGLSYANNLATHHSCEDVAMLRALPGLSIVAPGDPYEVRAALGAALQQNQPTYLRLGKKGEPMVHPTIPKLTIGEAIPMRSGSKVALLSTGTMLPSALSVAEELSQGGIDTAVWSFHTIKPLDAKTLKHTLSTFKLVVTLEEHSHLGGLGSAITEWASDFGPYDARILRLGTSDRFLHEGGEQEHARALYGLDSPTVISRIKDAFQRVEKGVAFAGLVEYPLENH